MSRLLLLAFAALLLACAAPAAASTPVPTKLTFKVTLKIDSKFAADEMTGSGTANAEVIAQPLATSGGAAPSAWEGTGPVTVDNETYSMPGCTMTKSPSTGTLHVSITKSGAGYEVNWSPQIDVPPPVLICPPAPPAPSTGSSAVQPFLGVTPKTFTVPAAGGTQALSGSLGDPSAGWTNDGTMTVTPRIECSQEKVAKVETQDGGPTSLSKLVGTTFGAGQKITADANVQITFEDGSEMRMAKGTSFKESDDCQNAGYELPFRIRFSLLLGKLWSKITPDRPMEIRTERAVCGNRGTEFTLVTTRSSLTLTVTKGSMWIRRLSHGKEVGRVLIVKAGKTAKQGRDGKITIGRTKRGSSRSAWAQAQLS